MEPMNYEPQHAPFLNFSGEYGRVFIPFEDIFFLQKEPSELFEIRLRSNGTLLLSVTAKEYNDILELMFGDKSGDNDEDEE